jgi:hypothetical protein
MPTPAAPTILNLVSKDKSVYLNWTVPSMGEGESDIVDYVVQRKLANEPDSCFAVVDAVSKSDLSVPGATISGCNGLDYVFRVAAKNKFGVGEYSVLSSIISPSAVPSKPTAPTCIPGNGQITINWTAPANGGSPITDYVIQFRRQAIDFDNFYYTKGGGTINDGISTATTYTHTGLTNGATYGYRIAAKNATGQSAWSIGTPIVVPATGPQAPTSLRLTPNNGYINLSWVPGNNGGSPTTGYIVQRKLASDPDSSFAIVWQGKGLVSGGRAAVNIPGINGVAYVFKVASKNAVGTGPYTASSAPVTPCTVPDGMTPPIGVPGNGQITLNWTAPNNGGSPITDYVIQYQYCNPAGVCLTATVLTLADGVSASTSYVVSQLDARRRISIQNGWRYRFRMWARNAAGAGSVSNFSPYYTPRIDVPSAPTNLTATLVGNTSVRLNFTPPTGSGTITGYIVRSNPASGGLSVIDTNYQLGGLISGLTDEPTTFVIAAKNSAGIGTDSNESNSVTPLNRLFNKSSWKNVIDEPYRTWLNRAADRLDRYIRYNASARATIASENPGWNGLALSAYYLFTDSSPDNYIAACGVDDYKSLGGKKYNSITFGLEINDYYSGFYSEKDWVNILTHELGHALGIGIFWDSEYFPEATSPSNYFLNGSVYTGAQSAYNSITRLSRVKVPLENIGGAGTASGHWDDSFRRATAAGSLGLTYPGFKNELMVGYFVKNTTFILSQMTIKTLVDFGWEEINPGASEGVPGLKLATTSMLESPEIIVKCGHYKRKAPQQLGVVGLTVNVESAIEPPVDNTTSDSTVE